MQHLLFRSFAQQLLRSRPPSLQPLQPEFPEAFLRSTKRIPSVEMEDLHGTPITGHGVSAATTPGKCAAPPAPAIRFYSALMPSLQRPLLVPERDIRNTSFRNEIPELIENFGSFLHNGHVGSAAHNYTDNWLHTYSLLCYG